MDRKIQIRLKITNRNQQNNTQNMDFLKDLWLFMKERKKYWLVPVIIVLLLLGLLIIFGGGSAVAPFVYTLF